MAPAVVFAPIRATSSTPGPGAVRISRISPTAPLLSTSPVKNTSPPCAWCFSTARLPVTPKVYRRFAAVLGTTMAAEARAFATSATITCRSPK